MIDQFQPKFSESAEPKSAGRIRSTLKSVHLANERIAPPGPLVDGLLAGDWIRVATFRPVNHDAEVFCRELTSAGIPSREYRESRRRVVEVQRTDFDQALERLEWLRAGQLNAVKNAVVVTRATRRVGLIAIGLIFLNLLLFTFCMAVVRRYMTDAGAAPKATPNTTVPQQQE